MIELLLAIATFDLCRLKNDQDRAVIETIFPLVEEVLSWKQMTNHNYR